MTLSITITTKSDTDFDGNDYSFKLAEAILGGEGLHIAFSGEANVSDEQIKTDFKSKLTSLGYAWDNEI